jgi:beta-xylosidase
MNTGNAITRKSQVDLSMTLTKAVPLHDGHTMIGAGGLFAPTIRYHDGTFYIICTNVMCEGAEFNASNFYVTTKDIWSGSWSDPIAVDLHGIDPSLFIDDDGRAYVQGSWRLERTEQPTSTIKQWEIDLKTGQRISDIREIWPGYSRIYTEGPHIYKKDGWYYLLVAEGGTFDHHHLSMARAKEIWGPYESCPHNPVLSAEGKSEIVQDTGHGELFQDRNGQWWAAVLGVRKYGDATRYPLGRETFLAPVDWPEGSWPELQHPTAGAFTRLSPNPSTKALVSRNQADGTASVSNCFIRNPVAEDYQWSVDEGTAVALRASSTDLTVPIGTSTFVGRRQRRLKGSSASASLLLNTMSATSPETTAVRAGLAIYKDDFRHAAISLDTQSSAIVLSMRNNMPQDKIVASEAVDDGVEVVSFKMTASLEAYEFAYRVRPFQDEEWRVLGKVDTRELTARDFTGTVIGIYAYQQGGDVEDRPWVKFSEFHVDE